MKAWGPDDVDDSAPSFADLFGIVGWKVRFAAIDAHDEAGRRRVVVDMPPSPAWLDRISPFDPSVGYRRRRLRGVLYRLRYPRYAVPRWWRGTVESATRPAWIGPGRYEGNDPRDRLRAQWLDMHREWASLEAGDAEDGGHVSAFVDMRVPWAYRRETWLMESDSQGFVSVWRCDEAYAKGAVDRAAYGMFSYVDEEA